MFKIELRGFKELRKKIEEDKKRYINAAKAAQIQLGVILIRNALIETPSLTGRLKSSAYVKAFAGRRGVYTKAGFTAPYAAAVHKARIKRNGRIIELNLKNGTPKFLARAMRPFKTNYARDLAVRTRAAYEQKLTPEMVNNPYQKRGDSWAAFNREIRKVIREQKKSDASKWRGFNTEVRRAMRAQKKEA